LQKKKVRNKILIIILSVIVVITSTVLYFFNFSLADFLSFSTATLSYYGSRGQEVINIQSRLRNWGYYDGIVDGIFGYKTFNAVKLFQQKNGLTVDGIVGPETLAALGLPTGSAPTANQGGYSGGSSADIELLARLVHGEARGEPYEGKVAVAAVVLNRTEDPRFPKTIAGVIYEPGAFDAVSDGQINLQPDQSSYNAARDAMNGWDPSYGCVYYYNPATATSSWIWSRQIVVKIGNHNFAK
jgi:N-acetylmuramoyl-L-alanine amidase